MMFTKFNCNYGIFQKGKACVWFKKRYILVNIGQFKDETPLKVSILSSMIFQFLITKLLDLKDLLQDLY